MFPVLLDRVEIAGAVITADATHAQRSHATYLAERGAHTCSRSSATSPPVRPARLPAAVAGPGSPLLRERGHRYDEHRTLKVTAVAGLAFPHAAAQAIQMVRRRRRRGRKRWSRETVYAITSLTATQASPPNSPSSSAATG